MASDEPRPRVSVVVLSYNTREVLLRCLEVLGAGDPPEDMQIIVVDNASTDGSAEAVGERFPDVELVVSETNRLYAGGMNLGASRARGEHVLLLNADTEVGPDQVRELADYLDGHPRVGAVGPAQVNAAGRPERPRVDELSVGNLVLSMLGIQSFVGRHVKVAATGAVAHLSGSAIMLRREIGERLGYFDEGFRFYWEDTDLSRRIRDLGYELHIVSEVQILHRHAASSRQVDRGRRRVWAAQGFARYAHKHCPGAEAALMFALRLVFCLVAGLVAAVFTVLTLGQVGPIREHAGATFAVAGVMWSEGLLGRGAPSAAAHSEDTEGAHAD